MRFYRTLLPAIAYLLTTTLPGSSGRGDVDASQTWSQQSRHHGVEYTTDLLDDEADDFDPKWVFSCYNGKFIVKKTQFFGPEQF